MKRIFKPVYVLALLVLASCMDDITDLNTSPKSYNKVPGSTLFTNGLRNLTDAVTYGVTFKVLAQQWSETTYTDASRYNLPNVGAGFWNSMYRDVLVDFKEAKRLINLETGGFPEVKQNKLAVIDIMEVYTYSLLVNTFGDVPYGDALDFTKPQPTYEDGMAIYTDLFARLDADVANLNADFESMGSADPVYGGDAAAWKTFANSLRLRMAMTLADVNAAMAKTQAEKAVAAGVFTSNADNGKFMYLGETPNTNQIWVNLVQSGREDYVASNTLVNLMESFDVNDPRLKFYFNEDSKPADADGPYSGGTFGISNNFGNFSHVSDLVTSEAFPGTLLDYSEVEFYLAEAASRGFNVGGTVAEHYTNAIKASITDWGGTDAEAAAYVARPSVAFATATGTAIQKIATQKYIALYNRGLEAWTEYRRLDYPVLNTVPVPLGDFPIRYTYPVNEQNLNEASWSAASAKIGGDLLTTRVFWDVK